MIIRLMGLGQWSMEPEALMSLNDVDEAVEEAVAAGDQDALRVALHQLIAGVQEKGIAVPDDVSVESDLVLPDIDASVDEVRALLDSTQEFYGLIPSGADDGDARS